jgi:hypothetical protein
MLSRWFLGCAVLAAALVATACTERPCEDCSDHASSSGGTGPGGGHVGGGQGGTGPEDPCEEGIETVVVEESLGRTRLFALATQGETPVALLVDTASQVTFLSTPPGSPDYEPHVGDLVIGCETRAMAGRPYSAAEEEELAGYPVVGFLGADFFLEELTRIDFEARRIERIVPTGIRPEATGLPYQDVYGFLFVDVAIDGVDLTLGFDTGAPHALWIGVDGQPGDIPVQSVDGFGNPITYYLGTGEIAYAEAAYTIPVLRVLEHPSIEASNQQLGVTAHGLFGLTTIPRPSVVIDAASQTVWLE